MIIWIKIFEFFKKILKSLNIFICRNINDFDIDSYKADIKQAVITIDSDTLAL